MSASAVTNVSLFECAVQYDSLSRKQKRIILAFLYFYEKKIIGDHKETHPSVERIRKMAGCAKSTVCKFLKECFDFFFKSISKVRNTFQKTFLCNVYEFHSTMFNFLLTMKQYGYLQNWDKHRLKVFDMYCPDKELIAQKLSQIVYEETPKIGPGSVQKSDTIKDSMKDLDTCKKSVHISDENRRKAYGVLTSEGLSHDEAMKISKGFSFEVIFEARKRAHWYKKHKEIRNLAAFFVHACKSFTQKAE